MTRTRSHLVHALLINLLSISLALAATSSVAASDEEPNARLPKNIPPPDHSHPLELALSLPSEKVFVKGEGIELHVRIINRSQERFMVCIPQWSNPKYVVSFEVYDREGEKMPVSESSFPFFALNGDSILVMLGPGELREGIVELGVYDTVYDFGKGSYFVVAKYSCPLRGETEEGVRIAGEDQRSNAVAISVDYRNWFRRLVGLH